MEDTMFQGLINPVKGLLKEQMRMDVVSSNLANASTCGYKKTRIAFQDVLETQKNAHEAGAAGPHSASPSLVRTEIDFTPGDFKTTGNKLDMAIHGEGFFKVMTPDGVMYSRKGSFSLDSDGFLVTQNGDMVLGEGGPIQVQGNDILVNDLGEVSSDGDIVGTLALASFENKNRLLATGRTMFANPANDPELPVPLATRIKQGCLELPNVDIAEEMVSMIHCMRAFESYQKAVQILDEVNQRAINDVSRIR
ncbi:MAG: flagellar basal-body rod protein FlgF [Desulfatiglandales bacterium]